MNLCWDIAHKKMVTEYLQVAAVYTHVAALGVCG
jgi:hypothetical protein